MNYELLEKLIPQRRVFDSPREPSETLMDLHRSLATLRKMLADDDVAKYHERLAAPIRTDLERQERQLAAALE